MVVETCAINDLMQMVDATWDIDDLMQIVDVNFDTLYLMVDANVTETIVDDSLTSYEMESYNELLN